MKARVVDAVIGARTVGRSMGRASRLCLKRTSVLIIALAGLLCGLTTRAVAAVAAGGTAAPGPAVAPVDDPPREQPPADPGPQGRARGKRGGPPAGLWDRLSDDERKSMEAFVQEHFPGMSLELKRLRAKNRERFVQRMRQIAPELRRMEELMRVNPEQGAMMIQERQLDLEARRLAGKFRALKDKDQKPPLRKQIRKLCEKEFDCRHQRRALEIRELEARLAELKVRHAQAAQMRDQLVEQELKERLEAPEPPKPEDQPKPKEQPKPKQPPKPKAAPKPKDQPPTP